MGTYNSAVITNGGQSMIAQAVAGASLEFTTIRTSSYAYPAGTNLATLTTINGIKQSKDITGAAVYNSRVIKISAAVDNTGISTAYAINTIGIYAKVGSAAEALFAVVTASSADTMPAYDNKPYSYIYDVNLTMQNAANVTVTVNAAGLVNVSDLNAAKVEIQGEIADLKSAIGAIADGNEQIQGEIADLKSAIGAIADGNEQINLALHKNPYIRFESVALRVEDYNYPITFYCNNSNYSFYIIYYDSNNAFISNSGWRKTKYIQIKSAIPANAVTMKMVCKADDEHALNDSEKTFFSAFSVANFFVDDRTLFVSASGNDANNGTKDSPLKTITRALELNAKTILVVPGTYSERLNFYDVHGLKIMPWNYGTFAAGDEDKKIILDGINSRPLLMLLENCTDITLVGIKVINFTASGFRFKDCSNIHMLDCEAGAMYGSYPYGIGFEFINTNGDVESCYAHDVSLDGFNIHGFGTTKFVNCVAKNCGDDGISHHDACIGYISGGEYSGCGKGGIASPTYGAVINIDSAYCHDNLYGIYAVSNASNKKSKAIVSNCVLRNNTNKDIYIDYADVTMWNTLYEAKTVGSNGTLTELS